MSLENMNKITSQTNQNNIIYIGNENDGQKSISDIKLNDEE